MKGIREIAIVNGSQYKKDIGHKAVQDRMVDSIKVTTWRTPGWWSPVLWGWCLNLYVQVFQSAMKADVVWYGATGDASDAAPGL